MSQMETLQEFKEFNKKWIYRYRPYSTLSLKELIYNEIFFSYADELNDPLDLVASLVIKPDGSHTLEYFIKLALKNFNPDNDYISEFSKSVSKEILKKEISIDELVDNKYKAIYKKYYNLLPDTDEESFYTFINNLTNVINNLKPQNLTSISFSKKCDNPLLWSLYANRHKGFCFIFNPSNGKIRLKKKPQHTTYEEYECYNLNYSDDIKVDLALMFNEKNKFDAGLVVNDYFDELRDKAILTKNPEWLKEKEIRTFGPFGTKFGNIEQKRPRESSFNRIYYFDLEQLVGVILGFGLSEEEIKEIEQICRSKKSNIEIYKAKPVGNGIKIYKKQK